MNPRLLVAFTACLAAASILAASASASVLSLASGGWCWFADPRAIAWRDDVYLGWIDGHTGAVEVGRFNLATGYWSVAPLLRTLPMDDHSNPTLAMLPNRHLVAFYSPHSGKKKLPPALRNKLWYRVAVEPRGIGDWGPERAVPTNTPGRLGFTYPSPMWAEHRLYVFWRGGDWQPTYSTTTMAMRHWTRAQTLLTGVRGERPYVKYDNYGSAIRFAYTAAHPTRKATDLYFGELRGWAVRKADGTPFRSRHHLPFAYTKGERIYSWRTDGRAWVWDIAHDARGHPVIVYAVIRNEFNHAYRYARWTGTHWEDHRLTPAGTHIDEAPGYSAGVTLDHANPNIVYLSRENSKKHFEIYRYETHDEGGTWLGPRWITKDSIGMNMRPFVPLGTSGERALLWLWGRYKDWTDFGDLHVVLRADLSQEALDNFATMTGAGSAARLALMTHL